MKAGGLLTATAVLAILAGLIWWTNKHPSKPTTPVTDTPKIIALTADSVNRITITKQGSEPIELAKLAKTWTIAKPTAMPADQDTVSTMVSTISSLNGDRLIDEHASDLNEFGLNNPTEEVDVQAKGSAPVKLLLGSNTPAGNDVYAKIASSPKVYTVPSYTKTTFDKSVSDLRDKRLLTFNQDKLTAVTLAAKGPEIVFNKNAQGDWQITKPEPMRADTMQVDDFIRKLRDAKMDLTTTDATAKDAASQFASGTKVGTATVTDNSGTQTIEVRKGKDNNYFAKSSVVEGIFKTTGDLGDGMNKTVDDFRNKKLFDFGFDDPKKLELDGKAYQKSGDKWTSGSTQYDSSSIQTVIDKLRDMAATKFSDKMGGTQAFTVAVTSGDKNRFEKVAFNKDGDVYDSQRENEPAVYVLDAKTVDDLRQAISAIKPAPANSGKKK